MFVLKIAVVGDFHFPFRSKELILIDELEKEEPDLIIGTGDYSTEEVIERLREISQFVGVKGNTDHLDLPESLLLKKKGFKIGVFHSSEIYPRGDLHQIYHRWIEKKPDIIIFGHTHIPLFTLMGKTYMINPGSFNGVPLEKV